MREAEIKQVSDALLSGQSLLVLGEPGSGKSTLGLAVEQRLDGERWSVAIAHYNGSAKECLVAIADQLGVSIMTDAERPKALTAAQLRDALTDRLTRKRTVLICDDAHRWSASLRYWLEDVLRAGGILLLLAASPCPPKDLFMKMPRIELVPLKDEEIRHLMMMEAELYGYQLSPTEVADLQQKAGQNPALAKRVIREAVLGLSETAIGDHYQYIDGTPFLVTAASMIGIIRFMGLGLGDKVLYIVGGIATIVALALRSVLYAANRGGRRL